MEEKSGSRTELGLSSLERHRCFAKGQKIDVCRKPTKRVRHLFTEDASHAIKRKLVYKTGIQTEIGVGMNFLQRLKNIQN